MKTAIRPPTKRTRRKEMSIDCKVPMQVFLDLMKPMDDGDMKDFLWEDNETKTKLTPTKDGKSFQDFKYLITGPRRRRSTSSGGCRRRSRLVGCGRGGGWCSGAGGSALPGCICRPRRRSGASARICWR
eukprot:1486784-Prymnesium_polylepis.1